MITLLENQKLCHISKVSFAFTSCLIAAFKDSALAPEVWVQTEEDRITAVISRFGGRVNLTYLGGNTEEIKEFLDVIGFSELFLEESAANALGYPSEETFTVLKTESFKQKDFPSLASLKRLYEGLSFGADGDIELPEFEIFAPDVSHRLRHLGAVGIAKDFGAALAFCGEGINVINGIAIDKNHRNAGLGKKLLFELLEYLNGETFVLANGKTAEFYIKNGFSVVDTAVLIRG